MPTREIPQIQWPSFFRDYTRTHQGWTMVTEKLGLDLGEQPLEKGQAFAGITAEILADGRMRITITSQPDEERITEDVVEDAAYVRVRWDEMGTREAIQIETYDKHVTLIDLVRRAGLEAGGPRP
jgi:hypothetical protein